MDFRQWQAGYHPTLADVKVKASLDLARARIVARYTFKVLAAREKQGFGAWRMVSLEKPKPCNGWDEVRAEVNRRLDAGIPSDWCICGADGVHVYESSVCSS